MLYSTAEFLVAPRSFADNVHLYFCFLLEEVQIALLSVFLLKSPNLFYILKVPQNTFHSNIKKIQQQKYFDIRHQFQRPAQVT